MHTSPAYPKIVAVHLRWIGVVASMLLTMPTFFLLPAEAANISKRIYYDYSTSLAGYVNYVEVGSNQIKTVFTGPPYWEASPTMITVNNDTLYWSTMEPGRIYCSDLEGGGVQILVIRGTPGSEASSSPTAMSIGQTNGLERSIAPRLISATPCRSYPVTPATVRASGTSRFTRADSTGPVGTPRTSVPRCLTERIFAVYPPMAVGHFRWKSPRTSSLSATRGMKTFSVWPWMATTATYSSRMWIQSVWISSRIGFTTTAFLISTAYL